MEEAKVNHVYIITHTDLDGVASAGIALRILRRSIDEATVIYSEPYNLHERLGELSDYVSRGDLVIIADLGVNSSVINELLEALEALVSAGARIEWFDHHIWDKEYKASIEALGVKVWIDTTTCATGVVAKYLPLALNIDNYRDSFAERLVSAACSADLWRWDDPLSPKLFRVSGDRENAQEWRNRLVDLFSKGSLWSRDLDEKLEDYVNSELANFNRVLSTVYVLRKEEVSIAVAVKWRGPPSNGIIGASLLSRFDADIAAILRLNGGLSLRSRGVDVQRIAHRLGGGGHPRAAGARLRIPWIIAVPGRVFPRLLSWYASRVIYKAYLSE